MYKTKFSCYHPVIANTDEAYYMPSTDIIEKDDTFFLRMRMPGVAKENLKIKIENSLLTVTGRISDPENEKTKFILRENWINGYSRVFKLAESIDVDTINAELHDGILVIELRKKEGSKTRTITIK